MLTDNDPAVWHDDDYIREWARQRGYDIRPYVDIELCGAIFSDEPDVARIYWCDKGSITRYKLEGMGRTLWVKELE